MADCVSQRPYLPDRQNRFIPVAGDNVEARDHHLDRVSRKTGCLTVESLAHSLCYIVFSRTPAGVGWSSEPKNLLEDGDEFSVFVSHGVGTLITKIETEK